jgi:plastocyanin
MRIPLPLIVAVGVLLLTLAAAIPLTVDGPRVALARADGHEMAAEEWPMGVSMPVQMSEYWFDPMALTVVAGQTTTFELEVVGADIHRMDIAGEGIEMRSPTVRPGQPISWEVVLDTPGTYEVWCSFTSPSSHRDLGMVATLEVLPGAAM